MVLRRGLFGAALFLTGCSQQDQQDQQPNDAVVPVVKNEVVDEAQEASDDTEIASADAWSITDGLDRITDQKTIQATQKFAGSVNDIEVLVTCLPGKPEVSYEISGFKKDGEGAPMPRRSVRSTVYNEVTYRIDDQPALEFVNGNPQYSNQTRIRDIGSDWAGTNAAQASTLTLRVQFLNANETYVVDQSTASFREAVKPCIIAREEYVRKEQERESIVAANAAAAEQKRKEMEANQPGFDLSEYQNEN